MNLFEQLPDGVEIDGEVYAIDTDFRACLRAVSAFEKEFSEQDKYEIMLQNLYIDRPVNIVAAVEQAAKFLNGGETLTEDKGQPKTYSFEKDAALILGAFQQVHGIDLGTAEMHWWRFRALFIGLLGSDTPFGRLVNLRQRVKTGKATKEEKEIAHEMGSVFELDDQAPLTKDELDWEDDFDRQLAIGRAKQQNGKLRR